MCMHISRAGLNGWLQDANALLTTRLLCPSLSLFTSGTLKDGLIVLMTCFMTRQHLTPTFAYIYIHNKRMKISLTQPCKGF